NLVASDCEKESSSEEIVTSRSTQPMRKTVLRSVDSPPLSVTVAAMRKLYCTEDLFSGVSGRDAVGNKDVLNLPSTATCDSPLAITSVRVLPPQYQLHQPR